MGKPTGFLDYARVTSDETGPKQRIKNFNEFHTPLPLEAQRTQAARCMDCGVPFCQSGMLIHGMASGCPLNNLIPEWNDLLYNGNMEQAYHRLHKTNCFPEFTSRVCPSPCEAACTCKPPTVRTGKKVAVIGSGPSGLAAADQLNGRGHSVTVFERSDRIGGLLMYGIPNMKIEKKIIDRKVEVLKAEGVTFVTNANVGATPKMVAGTQMQAIKVEDLLKDYDRVILACGASRHPDEKETAFILQLIS